MIVMITSGQPSLNPRLVKEADVLVEAGYKVIVLYQYWNDWGTALDKELLLEKKWQAICVGGNPKTQQLQFLMTRILHKLGKFLAQKFGFGGGIGELALGRCSFQLVHQAKKIQAELYISHNLAALPAAVLAARKNNSLAAFDAEDFHRNEVSDDPKNFDVQLKTYLENKYVMELDYLSTASPFISSAYKELYPKLQPFTLLNVFPKPQITVTSNPKSALKLFWFSQTIGKARGLELVIEAIADLKNYPIELHLLGYVDQETKDYFGKIAASFQWNEKLIFYYSPIPNDEIFALASTFDVGLATEIGTPKNRDICLTNKIFTYIQSGLPILASATTAQLNFMETYPNVGLHYQNNDKNTLILALKKFATDEETVLQFKKNTVKYANETLNWEVEKRKFLNLVATTLAKAN